MTLSREAIPIDKKVVAIIALAICVAGGFFGFSFGTTDISGDRIGVDSARADIQSAVSQQSAAIEGLRGIEGGLEAGAAEADRLSAGLGDTAEATAIVESRSGEDTDRTRTSQQLVEEGRRILEQIRKRGPVGH